LISEGANNTKRKALVKSAFRCLLAVLMTYAGLMHFKNPAPFESIVPAAFPYHHALVLISGVFEILGGAGLLIPVVRRAAAWGLIALFIAVFPANINMAIHTPPHFASIAPWLLWLRLPLQAVLIAWAWWLTRKE
jgi:uncharacterized membrane protein